MLKIASQHGLSSTAQSRQKRGQVVRDSLYAGNFDSPIWVGLDNYKGVLSDPQFRQSILNNMKLLLTVPVMIALGLVIALVLNDRIRGMRQYRAVGAGGGPKIITTVLMELIEMLDLNHTPAQALAAPRIHNQWSPEELFVEPSLDVDLQKSLAARGQKVSAITLGSTSHIVARSADGKSFVGAADPRAGGTAEGW